MPKFVRTDSWRFSRIGKNRRKLQVWRRARGKHSKIRRKRKGYPVMPTVGYETAKKDRGKIGGLKPILIHNMKELSQATKNNVIIIARVGAKNKMELLKKADEMKIKVMNAGGKK